MFSVNGMLPLSVGKWAELWGRDSIVFVSILT
jgi:hypothetical protein